MKHFLRKYLGSRRFAAEWDAAIAAYRAQWDAIRDRLPPSIVLLEEYQKRRPFHDAVVRSISRPERDVVRIDLDDWILEFLGVTDSDSIDLDEDGDVWLYDEVDAAAGGRFELRALFADRDFRVIARDVRLFDKSLRRFVVPPEPPPPPPTLFLNRKRK